MQFKNTLYVAYYVGFGAFAKAFYWEARHRRRLPEFKFGTVPDWLKLAKESRAGYRRLKSQWRGKRVYCIGNGPSLSGMDLSRLNGQLLLGTNRAYRLLDQIKPEAFHLVVQDNYRLAELEQDIEKREWPLHISACHFFSGTAPPQWARKRTNTYCFMPKLYTQSEAGQINAKADVRDGFSLDPRLGLYQGHSVIFSAIQLAYYFGAKEIVCLGIDMDYSGPTSFIPGVKHIWPDFSYEKHCRSMFKLFRSKLEERGCLLLNATPGGKVDVLERVQLANIT